LREEKPPNHAKAEDTQGNEEAVQIDRHGEGQTPQARPGAFAQQQELEAQEALAA
jgi:hypothetical protein